MLPHDVNEKNNFIAGWYIPEEVCDSVLKYFEDHPEGHFAGHSAGVVDLSIKESTDLYLPPGYSKGLDYFKYLGDVVNNYINLYPNCAYTDEWGIVERVNIQKYNPGQGYYSWHCEVGTASTSLRHLTFITYLNTLEEGGTEFLYQKTTIKAEKGLTVIFPTIWTHTHRGQIASIDTKIITTGWLNYLTN